jgi:hypothetical protein
MFSGQMYPAKRRKMSAGMKADALAKWWWVHIPTVLRPYSGWLAAAWSDGDYFLKWPILAVALPTAMLVIGLFEGATHWSPLTIGADTLSSSNEPIVFAQMLLFLVLLVVVASLSANLGLILVLGFAVADLIAGPRLTSDAPWMLGLLQLRGPQLVNDALMIMLVVSPAVTTDALFSDLEPLRARLGAAYQTLVAIFSAATRAVILYAWVLSIPMIMRIAWIWVHDTAPVGFYYFVQVINPWLPIVVALVCAARAAIVLITKHDPIVLIAAGTHTRPATAIAKLGAIALLSTMFLAGYIGSVWSGVLVFIVIAAFLIAGAVLLPRLAPWSAWAHLAGKVPALVRYVVFVPISYFLPDWLLAIPGWSASANGIPGQFGVELVGIGVLLAIGLALFPVGAARPSRVPLAAAPMAILVALLFTFSAAPARAICLDPSCCFNGQNWLVALALAALGLALLGMLAPAAAAIGAAAAAEGAAEAATAAAAEAAAAEAAAAEAAAAEAAAAESAAAEAAAEDVTGQALEGTGNLGMPDFNPEFGEQNCPETSIAVDNYLSGGSVEPATAADVPADPNVLAGDVGSNLSGPTNFGDIEQYLTGAGDGSRGILYVSDGTGAHFFNAYNAGGQILGIDGQAGVFGSLSEVSGFAGYGNPSEVLFIPTYP